MKLTDDQRHHGIAILVGIGLAIAGAIALLIVSDPTAWTEALSTPCNLAECL